MSARYAIFPIVFNASLWESTMKSIPDADIELFASAIGCAANTIKSWREVSSKTQFPHPSMHNFIAACNALDLNPQGFFILDVKEGAE